MNRKHLFILLPAMFLQGCISSSLLGKNYTSVSAGMNKEELVQLLGQPKNKQFRGSSEAWQYCATGFSTDLYVLVWVESGSVIGMQTNHNSIANGACGAGFSVVNWEDKPDRVIEIRDR